ncbi:MAG TPA: hypothetical protein VF791_06690 [Pyrinomonadaceae bacterium]
MSSSHEGVRAAGRRALHAFLETWPYVLLGLLTGGGLLILQDYLRERHAPELLVKLVEHLGVGFLVSSIAVFFYEWGSHAKKMQQLNERLLQWERAKPEENLTRSIRRLFNPDDEREASGEVKELSVYCKELVMHISKLLQNRNSWCNDQHVDFLLYFLKSYLVKNAKTFTSLNDENVRAKLPFVVPQNAAELTSSLLTYYMQTLNTGDSYISISNLPVWQNDQLTEFHKATTEAMKRGVKVRRIFNFARNYRVVIGISEAIYILELHLKYVETSEGNYQVKVLGQHELKKSTSKNLESRIGDAHFGIFRHDKEALRLEVRGPELSEMFITKEEIYTEGRDDRLFDEAWAAGIELKAENFRQIITNLAEELGQTLPQDFLSEPSQPVPGD